MPRKNHLIGVVTAFLASIFVCFLASPSPAQPIASSNIPFTGLSAFPIMNARFPYNEWKSVMAGAENPALALLWGTFEGKTPIGTERVRDFLNTNPDRPHLLEIHLTNQTCYKPASMANEGRKCSRGELAQDIDTDGFDRRILSNRREGERLRNRVTRRVIRIKNWVDQEILPFVANSNNVSVVLSTGLEDEYSPQAYRKMRELINAGGWTANGRYQIVRNPLNNRDSARGANFAEFHPGTRANAISDNWKPFANRGSQCIANLDGVSTPGPASDTPHTITGNEARAFIRRHRRCFAVLLWNEKSQGSESGKTPRQRDFTIPTPNRIRRILASLSSANP